MCLTERGREQEGEGHDGALATYPPALAEKRKVRKSLSFQITHWKAQNRREEQQRRRARVGPRGDRETPAAPSQSALPHTPNPVSFSTNLSRK